MSNRSRLTCNTALLRRGFATLILAAGAAVVAPGDGFAQIAIVDENCLPGGTATREPPPEWIKNSTRDWMAFIPDSVKLHKISIPGTHESAALVGGLFKDYGQCQSWNIKQQLEAGIRYLDIRVRRYREGFTIHHGRMFLDQTFTEVMEDVIGFLSEHPKETVLMRVSETGESQKRQVEDGGCMPVEPGKGCQKFEDIWKSYMETYRVNVWDNGGSDEIPKIDRVRGKIVVLRDNRYKEHEWEKIPSNWGLDYSVMVIQDKYKVSRNGSESESGPISLEEKKEEIKTYIPKADDNDKLVLNHLSGVWIGEGPNMKPLEVAVETNPFTYDKICDYVGQRTLGVLIMDYPGPRLVYRIVKSNFFDAESLPSDGLYTIRQKVNERFLDAYPSGSYAVVTRPDQGDDTQRWSLTRDGDNTNIYTIQQKINMRYLDAHESSKEDYAVVTRTRQDNPTQRWILTNVGGNTYTIQQKINMRYLDAHESSKEDYAVVTRTCQNNLTQRWIIVPVP